MAVVEATTPTQKSHQIEISGTPDECPICHHRIAPQVFSTVPAGDPLTIHPKMRTPSASARHCASKSRKAPGSNGDHVLPGSGRGTRKGSIHS